MAEAFSPPSNVADRISFQVHNFFAPQPDNGADVYLLRHILHDWSDRLAIDIIRQITKVMKDHGLIIIVDGVLPPPGVLPVPVERLLTGLDLQMWDSLNARERTLEDWASLLDTADSRLKIVSSVQPEGSADTVLVASFRK